MNAYPHGGFPLTRGGLHATYGMPPKPTPRPGPYTQQPSNVFNGSSSDGYQFHGVPTLGFSGPRPLFPSREPMYAHRVPVPQDSAGLPHGVVATFECNTRGSVLPVKPGLLSSSVEHTMAPVPPVPQQNLQPPPPPSVTTAATGPFEPLPSETKAPLLEEDNMSLDGESEIQNLDEDAEELELYGAFDPRTMNSGTSSKPTSLLNNVATSNSMGSPRFPFRGSSVSNFGPRFPTPSFIGQSDGPYGRFIADDGYGAPTFSSQDSGPVSLGEQFSALQQFAQASAPRPRHPVAPVGKPVPLLPELGISGGSSKPKVPKLDRSQLPKPTGPPVPLGSIVFDSDEFQNRPDGHIWTAKPSLIGPHTPAGEVTTGAESNMELETSGEEDANEEGKEQAFLDTGSAYHQQSVLQNYTSSTKCAYDYDPKFYWDEDENVGFGENTELAQTKSTTEQLDKDAIQAGEAADLNALYGAPSKAKGASSNSCCASPKVGTYGFSAANIGKISNGWTAAKYQNLPLNPAADPNDESDVKNHPIFRLELAIDQSCKLPAGSITEEFCGVCVSQFDSVLTAMAHYKSERHDRLLRKWFLDQLVYYGYVEKSDQQSQWVQNTLTRVFKRDDITPKNFKCVDCNIDLNSINMARDHFNSKNHKRMSQGCPKIQQMPKGTRKKYMNECVLCKATFTNDVDMKAHIATEGHQFNVRSAAKHNITVPPGPSSMMPAKKFQIPKKPQPHKFHSRAMTGANCTPLGGASSWTGAPSSSADDFSYETAPAKAQRVLAAFYCEVCNKRFKVQEEFDDHMGSLAHMRKEQQAMIEGMTSSLAQQIASSNSASQSGSVQQGGGDAPASCVDNPVKKKRLGNPHQALSSWVRAQNPGTQFSTGPSLQ